MPEVETSATSSKDASVPAPWWIRLCRWLWKIAAFLGISVLLSLAVNVLATWLTSPGGTLPANAPLRWLISRWPVTLLIGVCFLLLALLIGIMSRWPLQGEGVTSSLAQQNRKRMLRRLRRSYDDILAQSLEGTAWMELGLAQRPDAVRNAANLLLRLPRHAEQVLPPGTLITQVYEEAAHELLILGEPGAGKSTLLVQLARQLVTQADQDIALPLPVLLPLSSWAGTYSQFQDWLAEQVAQFYDIPEQLARRWVQEEQLLPLLDGLDEIEEKARAACIAAINAYHHAYPGPLVVCSRKAEYEEAAQRERLNLQSAVVVQQLSHEQVDGYLVRAGKPVEGLRHALNKNSALQKLASIPLMLNVLMLTYNGVSVRLASRKHAELSQQVWSDYVQRMVERKGNAVRYPLERTRSWLHWLAYEMREHNQTVFYLEHLQPDWLPARQQLTYTWLAVRIPGVLIGVIASLAVSLFVVEFLPLNAFGLLQFGILGGFLGWLFSKETRQGTRSSHGKGYLRPVLRERAIVSTLIGLVYGLSFGFYRSLNLYNQGKYGLDDWLRDGSIFGVGIGLSFWVLMSLLSRFSSPKVQNTARNRGQPRLYSWRLMHTRYGQGALLTAIVLGLGSGLSSGLSNGLSGGRYYGLDFVLGLGISIGLRNGLLLGLTAMLVSLILEVQTEDVHLTERLRWTWGSLTRSLFIPKHLRMTLLLASSIAILFGLSNGLDDGVIFGPIAGLLSALSWGVSEGLSFGIVYWLLFGLFQGISHEQVDNQDRRVFNQGIRRSLRNSVIMGIISGGVILITGILNVGLSIGTAFGPSFGLSITLSAGLYVEFGFGQLSGLHFGLNIGPLFGLSYWLLLAVCGGLLVSSASGGLAVLRHIVLRLLLWRTRTFPWRSAQFLEDAAARIFLRRIGGGYSFSHRLLMDYFLDL